MNEEDYETDGINETGGKIFRLFRNLQMIKSKGKACCDNPSLH